MALKAVPQLGFPRFRFGEEAWLDMRQEYSVAASVDRPGRVAVVAEVTSKGDKRHRLTNEDWWERIWLLRTRRIQAQRQGR